MKNKLYSCIFDKLKNFIINFNFFKERNKIELHRDNNFVIANIEISPKLINRTDELLEAKFKEYIKKFIATIVENIKTFNEANFINNFEKTYFEINDFDIAKAKKGEKAGYHCLASNKYKTNYLIPQCINHELLHLSTACMKQNLECCGFKTYDMKTGMCIGRGINEGYTELLNNRYFETTVGAYENEVQIMEVLELIVGRKKTEKLYFDINLPGLINELSKYESLKNVLLFIDQVDIINSTSYKFDSDKIMNYQNAFTSVYNFLYNCIKNKVSTLDRINYEALQNDIDYLFYKRKVVNLNDDSVLLFTCLDINLYNQYIRGIKDKNGKSILLDNKLENSKRINQ